MTQTWPPAGADGETENLTLVLDGNNAGPLKQLPASDSKTGSYAPRGVDVSERPPPDFQPGRASPPGDIVDSKLMR